jgi:hypothetical protein
MASNPTTPEDTTEGKERGESNKRAADTVLQCEFCSTSFPSRNQLFQHLRRHCAALPASPHAIPVAPSTLQKRVEKRQRAEAKLARQSRPGRTMQHTQHALWLGDLPLAWTRPTQQYQRLRLLLRAHLPRTSVVIPWIKLVQRKAYRRRQSDYDDAIHNAAANREWHDKDPYLGYAIVVFRDAEECDLVLKELHGREITVESVLSPDDLAHNTDLQQLQGTPPFAIQVRPYKSSGNSASLQEREVAPVRSSLPPPTGGPDPPLMEQWRPLTTAELVRRIEQAGGRWDCRVAAASFHDPLMVLDDESLLRAEHDRALAAAVELYQNVAPREVRHAGRWLPEALREKLRSTLQQVRWAVPNHRAGLTAERYLVLLSCVTNDVFYADLRAVCAELMQWADPDYEYTGIAVTQNFVGSPHIDDRDQTDQYAVSLGDFTGGGELCLDGGVDSSCGQDDDAHGRHVPRPVVHVWTTQDRIARVDGRRVHWVRRWNAGGTRYSLIFYNTRIGDRPGVPAAEP